ncbi:MAG: hypothetical protein OEV44_13705 [Spirochaetota bacterium]|nr:hypothetical protein [Spirochaetota bacterium]
MSQALNKLLKEGKNPNQLVQMGKSFTQSKVELEMSESIPESLDEIENQIKKLKGKSWEIFWYIGKRLVFIKENFLRTTEYTNISDYAKAKFDFSHGTTVNCIFIAKNFSLSHARDFGSKLRLLQPLDIEKRQAYLEWFEKENPTFREIEDRIKSETKKLVNSKEKYFIGKSKIIINLNELGKSIKKDKSDEFLKKLEALVLEYAE